jgi:hypothetical protein
MKAQRTRSRSGRFAAASNSSNHTLEVLRLEGGRWTMLATHAGIEVARAEPFEAIELALSALWGETAPST